eukprot:CAMPEP_0172895112 /NCGR_PEP_ID=MMETSP1075-20121228/152370_1 /TAXON_ID=2916 /ORGANISM="Ceratium fusus, Strain PA161109" /LENGTH=54 /DNA_ID=CAMNT_0013750267 /DNA_START=171 /DNA_END=335 /DNA_ORIENTATION=-
MTMIVKYNMAVGGIDAFRPPLTDTLKITGKEAMLPQYRHAAKSRRRCAAMECSC